MTPYLLFVACVFVIGTSALPPPTYLKPCSVSKDFDKCALESGIAVIPFFIKGDKKYGIPSIDPFKFTLLNISPGDRFNLTFIEMTTTGLGNAKLDAVRYDKDKKHMQLVISLDKLTLTGNYVVDGKILILPIYGTGPFEISVHDGTYTFEFDLESEVKQGVVYGKLVNDHLDFQLKNAKLNFENLFNGDPLLGPQLNNFINENWEEVFKDLGGAIKESFSTVCRIIVQNYFARVPLKDIMLE